MRLIILADAAAPHTRRWAKWFALKGHEVHVISFNCESLPNYGPVTTHKVWEYKNNSFTFLRILKFIIILFRIKKIINLFPPDIIHAHSAGGYAWAAALIRRKPFVITPWGTDLLVDINNSKLNYWLTSKSLTSSDLVTTDGYHFVEILTSLGVKKEKIYVHPFGTNLKHFYPIKDFTERVILHISDDAPVIISTRTLNPVHDVETFIRAIPDVIKILPTSIFIIVGDGIERTRFEDLVAELNISNVTRFVGMVEEDRMCKLLQSSDIYVSTSKLDAGLAASTAEAMAVGLPVIQTDNSDNSYWTPNGDGGILFPTGDSKALSTAIIELINNNKVREKMGKRNRNKVESEYNTDVEMLKIEFKYNMLMRG